MNIHLDVRLITCVLGISLLLWGCGSGGGGSAPPPDTLPPVSSISCSPLANAAGWNNKDVSCKLTATDNGSSVGVHEIRYRINSSPEFIVLGSSATVNVTDEGETTIIFFAVDFENNQEIPTSKSVLVDKSLPIITGIISPSPSSTGWNTTNVTVKFTCSDGPSGIASCPPDVDISTDVVGKVITANATDIAGNRASASMTVNLDKGPPNVLSTAPSDKVTEVDVNTNISAAFSEPMNPLTLTQNTFILKSGDSRIPGAVSLNGNTATFTPSSKLSFSTSYAATLTSNVRDL
ncbi:MAG: Ig-like domain-containing protein, partial [Nitrospiria bacterium]